MNWLHVSRSDSPLILAFPHGGTQIPAAIENDFVDHWRARRDADWHIAALYEGLADATCIRTEMSRSVIDCNRPPDDSSLYPGKATTGLCPTETFDGEPLYREGRQPDVDARRDTFHRPYHAAIESEIERLRALHGTVVLYDCHSIRSQIPRLFDGELSEFNIGTDNGVTCDPALADAIVAQCANRSHVLNGRFRGGWTTRHYGQPQTGVHAIQMEIAMRAYLDEPEGAPEPSNWPPSFDLARADSLRGDLARILDAALNFAKGRA